VSKTQTIDHIQTLEATVNKPLYIDQHHILVTLKHLQILRQHWEQQTQLGKRLSTNKTTLRINKKWSL